MDYIAMLLWPVLIICSCLLILYNYFHLRQCFNSIFAFITIARRSFRILARVGKHQFPLMELPREVRDLIYEKCLVFDGSIFVKDPRPIFIQPQKPEQFSRDSVPTCFSATAKARNLFYVSKQVRDEAAAIFYNKNTFEFAIRAMEKFVLNMGVRNQHHLRSIIVYYEGGSWCTGHEGPFNALARCVGLRDLTLLYCNWSRTTGGIWGHGNRDRFAPEPHWPPVFVNLLNIRGLDHVRLLHDFPRLYKEDMHAVFQDMVAELQILKQPRTDREAIEEEVQEENRASAST